MSKQTELEALKIEFPTLTRLDAGIVIELSGAEYNEQIEAIWQTRKNAQIRQAEAEAKAQAKADLLERLGITADEAKLLLS